MISTHILDLQSGTPAASVPVKLERRENGTWMLVADERTNADGRASFPQPLRAGAYRLSFEVQAHLAAKVADPFYSEIPVLFHVTDPARKLHVPLLLSPYGYSTYRGS
jgi:5-hydroxyisourate hydrolase